jgi:NAD(P)-dependent dehydrogenase (short-subunit alcohol dehydrogenase family)
MNKGDDMSQENGRPLLRKVALVAGATRGAGRAIAVELARAGAYVYATGRSSRIGGPSEIGRPETIEETGDLMHAAGGEGEALRVDHLEPDEVADLVARIEQAHGRLDVLVNDNDLVKAAVERITIGLTAELTGTTCTAVAVTPGWLRSENMLENFGVTEESWRDAVEHRPHFCISESPTYVARGIVALAADPDVGRYAGRVVASAELARTYGFTDNDGTQPDCWRYLLEIQLPGRPATERGYR